MSEAYKSHGGHSYKGDNFSRAGRRASKMAAYTISAQVWEEVTGESMILPRFDKRLKKPEKHRAQVIPRA
jgi:hypothetical protein